MIRHFLRKGGWGALFLLLIAGVFGGLALRERAMARALDDHGIAVQASIEGMRTERHVRRTKNGTTTETDHLVTYAFAAPLESGGAPRPQRVVHEVPGHVYDDLHIGQTVTIRYLPERPGRIDYFPGESRENALFLWVFATTFLVATSVAGGVAAHRARRAHRLDQLGVTVRGTVRSVTSRRNGLNICVAFTDANGAARSSPIPVARSHPLAGAAQGDAVWLRYDPQEPTNLDLAENARSSGAPALTPAIWSL